MDIKNSRALSLIWVGQPMHFISLTGLIVITAMAWSYMGRPFPIAFWTAVALPIVHQVFVWLAWRLELRCAGTSGSLGFHGYLVVFFVLFFARFLSLGFLAWVDRGSMNLSPITTIILTVLFCLPGLYAGYSVGRYFGMARAAGADHFDSYYRDLPLVKEGIFRFTKNGMYLYAFLLFWAIAIGFNSTAALAVAVFSHVYIWVHYFATEKPDMVYLYGEGNTYD
jgi:hypothetical protein